MACRTWPCWPKWWCSLVKACRRFMMHDAGPRAPDSTLIGLLCSSVHCCPLGLQAQASIVWCSPWSICRKRKHRRIRAQTAPLTACCAHLCTAPTMSRCSQPLHTRPSRVMMCYTLDMVNKALRGICGQPALCGAAPEASADRASMT